MVTLMDSRSNEQAQSQAQQQGSSSQTVTKGVHMMTPEEIKDLAKQFVLQYFTVMGKCPENLHRFYKEDSYFVRGDATVAGQVKIHEKIISMGLKDSRVSVLQLDALKAHQNSVIIQVSGEMSIAGSEMRRFMQSFVLVEPSCANLYVLNDIFRYQDEVYGDTRPNGGDSSDLDISLANNNQDHDVYESSFDPPCAEPVGEASQPPSTTSLESHMKPNGAPSTLPSTAEEVIYQTQPAHQLQPPAQAVLEPSAHQTDFGGHDQVVTADMNGGQSDEFEEDEPVETAEETSEVVEDIENTSPLSGQGSGNFISDGVKSGDSVANPASSEPPKPRSWANIISGQSQVSSANQPQQSTAARPASTRPTVNQHSTRPAGQTTNEQRPGRPNRSASPHDSTRQGGTGNPPTQGGSANLSGGGPPRPRSYPDNCQMFVGNLPHNLNEADLREFFGEFGQVVEVRINQSQFNRGGRGNLPNFGFVVFEDPAVVQEVTAKKSVYYNDKHRINVEEKKPGGGGGGNGRPSGPGNWGGRGGVIGGRRGGRN